MSESGDGQDHGGTPRPDALIPALDEGQVAAPNAVPSFKPAEWRNARITLGWMIGLLIAMFGGVLVITLLAGIVPVASQTMLSQLARDRQAPRSFLRIGDRLTFRNGILLLSVTSAALYGVGRVAVDDGRVGVRDGQLLFRPGKSRDVMAGAERLLDPCAGQRVLPGPVRDTPAGSENRLLFRRRWRSGPGPRSPAGRARSMGGQPRIVPPLSPARMQAETRRAGRPCSA